jgi:PKD repeat protein
MTAVPQPLPTWFSGPAEPRQDDSSLPSRRPFQDEEKTMRSRLILGTIVSVILLTAVLPSKALSATYYVSNGGSDSYNGLFPAFGGGMNGPFRTLGRAAAAVRAGDAVEIRGGIYQEASTWHADGTEAAPITITNFGDEAVIIDGAGNSIPGDRAYLMNISGDWYTVSDLEIRYSGGVGIGVAGGVHNTLRNLTVHHSYRSGIHGGGDYCTVEGCRVYWNSTVYEYGRSDTWSSGIALGRDSHGTVARNCRVWNNWGQGINSGFDSLIEDNVSWDNMCSFYVNDAQGVIFQRNLAYVTPGNALEPYVAFQISILIGDERDVPSRRNTFINNVAMGGGYVLSLGSGALEDCIIANNTLVNAYRPDGPAYTLRIGKGTYTNVLFQNNIIVQESTAEIAVNAASGINFVHNIWSRTPPTSVRGTGDIVADPKFVKAGNIGPGDLTAAYFAIRSDSSAKDAGRALPTVTDDYYGKPRSTTPDIGAIEIPESDAPLTAVASAEPVSGNFPLSVRFTGNAGGGSAPYSYGWSFGDGATSTAQNTDHTYTRAGIYEATLTVLDGKGSSANSTVDITVTAGVPLSARAAASPMEGQEPLEVRFSGSASGGLPPYSYAWSFGDGGISAVQDPSHTYTATGVYEALLTVTDGASARAYSTATVTVDPSTEPFSVSLIASATSGPAPLKVGFEGLVRGGQGPYSYSWTFGDGATSTSANPSHTYSAPGTYVATLTVRDAGSARAAYSVTISVRSAVKKIPPRGPRKRLPQDPC